MQHAFDVRRYGVDHPAAEITLHTEIGDIIASKEELLRTENVYVLRGNDLWIFPGIWTPSLLEANIIAGKYVGYKTIVAGHVVETLSLLPRVLKISDYLTEAECGK